MLIVWRLGASGDFATASNWAPAAVPGSADEAVIIGLPASYTVTSSVNETVDSLAILNAALSITGASSFTTTNGGLNAGTILIDSGSYMFIGTNAANTTTLANLGTIDLENDSVLWIGSGFQASAGTDLLTGGGHINLSGGEIIGAIFDVTVVSDNTISGTGIIDFSAGGQEAHGTWIRPRHCRCVNARWNSVLRTHLHREFKRS